MTIFALDERVLFPDPLLADDNGLLAVGGDLSPQRLLSAYSMGIFPWNHPEDPLLWWSPDPRCVLAPDELHISRSMAKLWRSNNFTITFDADFTQCIQQCSCAGQRQPETWISAEIIAAYLTLHRLGYAHSVECWQDNTLVGGLYGLAIGRCFCGESMFHRRANASKIAFIALAQRLKHLGYQMIDCQLPTEHLHSLGAYDIPRRAFLQRLRHCQTTLGNQIQPGIFPATLPPP